MLAYDPGPLFGVGTMLLIALLSLVVVAYVGTIPGRIARSREHPQATAVMVAGILGIFTFGIVWVIALIWAFASQPMPVIARKQEPVPEPLPVEDVEYVFCGQCRARMRKPAKPGRYRCPKCEALMVV